MARRTFKATKGASLGDGQYSISAGAAAPVSTTVLAGHVATAVAGGAGDVSATVTLISADTTALTAAISGDVSLTYDDATITNFNQLKRAVEALLLLAQSSGMV